MRIQKFHGFGSARLLAQLTRAAATGGLILAITVPALAAGPCVGRDFRGARAYQVGDQPRSVVVGDFNGDGRADLAVANSAFGANSVSILLGTPNGFTEHIDFDAGARPEAIALGDFNGDGRVDLAIASLVSNSVYVLLGTGTGAFSAATGFDVGRGQYAIAVGDLNGDGKPDIATAGLSALSVLLGTGTGTFTPAATFASGGFHNSVAIADFNHDGRADLAVAHTVPAGVSVFLGTGSGTFGIATRFDAGLGPRSVAVGDFNRDGNADLATANSETNSVSVLLGAGNGDFAAALHVTTGPGPLSIAVADIDGDGADDVAAFQERGSVSIVRGSGTGSFGAPTILPLGVLPYSGAVADVSGDGRADVVVADISNASVAVLLQSAEGDFPTASRLDVGRGPKPIVAGDLNGDGFKDLVVGNSSDSSASVLLGNGAGGFSDSTAYDVGLAPFTLEYLASGDVNRDGKLDLAAGFIGVSIVLGTGTGAFGAGTRYSSELVDSVAIGAPDSSHPHDVVAAQSAENRVAFFQGTLSGGLGPPTYYPTGDGPSSAVMTGEDMIVANGTSHDVAVLLGTPFTEGFVDTYRFDANSGPGPLSVVVGNLNNDGKRDIVVVSQTRTTVLLGISRIQYAAPISLGPGSGGSSAVIADLDGDGNNDVSISGPLGVSTFLGTGAGTFGPKTTYAVGDAGGLVVGDFNGDGEPDLALTERSSSQAVVLFATCSNAVNLSISDATVIEGDAGSQEAIFTVRLSRASDAPVTVSFATADHTATALSDYVALSGALTFLPGQTRKTITVTVTGDGVDEQDEAFYVKLTNPAGAVIVDAQGLGRILDDDPSADIFVTKTDGVEGVIAGQTVTYTITVGNAGAATANAVGITDFLPAGLTGATWSCVSANGATCSDVTGSGDLSTRADLDPGGTVTYTLAATVAANSGLLRNVATVTAPSGVHDPDPSNNSAVDEDLAVCGATESLVPDGRAADHVLASGATAWYSARLRPGGSYSIELTSETLAPPPLLTLFNGSDGCSAASTAVTRDTSFLTPRIPGLPRLSFSVSNNPYQRIRVENTADGPISFTLRLSETTLFSPAWSTGSTYETYYALHNTTSDAVVATLILRDTRGAVVGSRTLTVPPGTVASTNTAAMGVARGRSGPAELSHDGPPGALWVEADIANFSSTPAYVQRVKFVPIRASR